MKLLQFSFIGSLLLFGLAARFPPKLPLAWDTHCPGPDKPVIQPAMPHLDLMSFYLNISDSTSDYWEPGWIPQQCSTITSEYGFSSGDIFVYDVHYSDCSDPWIFCRHKLSPVPPDRLETFFGQIPVHTRSFVRHLLALPSHKPNEGMDSGNANDTLIVFGDSHYLTSYIHESGHSVDAHHFQSGGPADFPSPFSCTDPWLDAGKQDAAVCTPYAKTNQQENFAETFVVAVFDTVVHDGIGQFVPSWRDISRQFKLIQEVSDANGGVIKPGGTCTQRLANDDVVRMTGSPDRSGVGKKPSVALSDRVRVIPPLQEPMSTCVGLTQE